MKWVQSTVTDNRIVYHLKDEEKEHLSLTMDMTAGSMRISYPEGRRAFYIYHDVQKSNLHLLNEYGVPLTKIVFDPHSDSGGRIEVDRSLFHFAINRHNHLFQLYNGSSLQPLLSCEMPNENKPKLQHALMLTFCWYSLVASAKELVV